MLHHFQGKIDIGSGNGGIISQLKMQNEMKLTDESWISYQQGKGNEEYQKYMEDLTDMQNHVLPYLQSFCSLHYPQRAKSSILTILTSHSKTLRHCSAIPQHIPQW